LSLGVVDSYACLHFFYGPVFWCLSLRFGSFRLRVSHSAIFCRSAFPIRVRDTLGHPCRLCPSVQHSVIITRPSCEKTSALLDPCYFCWLFDILLFAFRCFLGSILLLLAVRYSAVLLCLVVPILLLLATCYSAVCFWVPWRQTPLFQQSFRSKWTGPEPARNYTYVGYAVGFPNCSGPMP
jgi:hypothetical protein